MFNMIKADIYRMFRGKGIYIALVMGMLIMWFGVVVASGLISNHTIKNTLTSVADKTLYFLDLFGEI